jgi:inward rectifier potassium channel
MKYRSTRSRIPQPIQSSFSRGKVIEIRDGIPDVVVGDLYHFLLTIPWIPFFGLLASGFLVTNAFFAYLYSWDQTAITGSAGYWDSFFFSVQTISTIGYGGMTPGSWYGNVLVTLQSLIGLLGVATATGLMFARISRPTARVMFSQVALITTHNRQPTLMFRVANQRRNQILEAQVRVTLVQNEITDEGSTMRRFYDLKLARSMTPIFAFSWTVMHPIDADSLLLGSTTQSLLDNQTEIIIILTGLDDIFNQVVHARHAYLAQDIVWGHRFQDMLRFLPDGQRYVDYGYFNKIVPDPTSLALNAKSSLDGSVESK